MKSSFTTGSVRGAAGNGGPNRDLCCRAEADGLYSTDLPERQSGFDQISAVKHSGEVAVLVAWATVRGRLLALLEYLWGIPNHPIRHPRPMT